MINHSSITPHSDFWEVSEYASAEYVCQPYTENSIRIVEDALGYKLPDSYINLLKTQNGGLPKKTCAPCNEPTSWASDHIAITGIFGIGADKPWSLCGAFGSQFMIDEWGYPDIGIYICDCPSAGHDMVALDYRACGRNGEPQVVHVDQEGNYKITVLAHNFEAFINALRYEDEFED